MKSPEIGAFLEFALRCEGSGRFAHFLVLEREDIEISRGTGTRIETLERLLTPAIESLECQLWGIEYQPRGRHSRLCIYIDREEGVTVDDCERVSREVSALLDVADPISGSYTLEVSSPGLDRMLFNREHYAESVGERVDLTVTEPLEGHRRFIGQLKRLDDDQLVIDAEGSEYRLALSSIQKARIVPRYE
ncbi:MAG: ribosome maturation factor RimP [Gammaproteobacteria bacterium]|nr:ribosome maturation factor RimP [Gammaproteobacteria bacterium]